MKFFLAIALIATVASAAIIKPAVVGGELAQIQEIIAAIQSPSTDPATAAALEQMLQDALGIAVGPAIVDSVPEPIAVGPAVIDFPVPEPVSVGPAIIDFPLPEGALAEESIIAPSPVAIIPGPVAETAAAAPLVQIILNINQAAAEVSPIGVGPAITPEQVAEIAPTPVTVVDAVAELEPPVIPMPVHPIGVVAPEPVQVVEVAPVQVVEVAPVPVEPVQVVEVAPIAVEPVIIGTPIIPAPAVVLPEELN